MKLQQYLQQINALQRLSRNQNPDLENVVLNIISKQNNFQFKPEDLFENENLNFEILSKIEKTLNLIFIKEEMETNVCFANNEEYALNIKTVLD